MPLQSFHISHFLDIPLDKACGTITLYSRQPCCPIRLSFQWAIRLDHVCRKSEQTRPEIRLHYTFLSSDSSVDSGTVELSTSPPQVGGDESVSSFFLHAVLTATHSHGSLTPPSHLIIGFLLTYLLFLCSSHSRRIGMDGSRVAEVANGLHGLR